MRMDIIKIDKNLFIIREIIEQWCLKVFDYPHTSIIEYTDGKYHRVMADSEWSANDLCDRAYKEYKDKKVEILSASIFLKHIIFEYEKKEFFKTRDLLDTFIEQHKDFNYADYSIIMKYKEFLQKEQHHKEVIKTKYDIGRGIQKSINIQSGLPIDWC